MPERLLEISALAMTPDERLLAVDDERAIVYELDYKEGGLVKAFALGEPVLRGDFEGLAVVDDRVFLLDSRGNLVAAREGSDGEYVEFLSYDTGLDDECEFEGLARDAGGSRLLLLCKDVLKKATIDSLSIFVWDVAAEALDEQATMRLPFRDISAALKTRRLHPSGIVVDSETGNMLLVAARELALIELDPQGGFVAAVRLPLDERHPQAEGIELTADGRLLLADEGGKGKARLSVYDRRAGAANATEDRDSSREQQPES